MSIDPFDVALEQFLAGQLPLEAAARDMSLCREFRLIGVRPEADAQPGADARVSRLAALMARVREIGDVERLVERAARAPRIDHWSAPSDLTDFCFSLEVVLTGRDAERVYTASYRLYVCTPAWIHRQVREAGPQWVTAPLVLPHWSPRLVHRALDELVDGALDETWWQFESRMSRMLEREG